MVTVSQLQMANKVFARYHRAKTLLATLERKREYLKDEIRPDHTQRLSSVKVDLKIFISQLDNKEYKAETPKWVSWPVKDVVQYVFRDINRDSSPNHTALEREACNLMTELGRQKAVQYQKFLICSEIAYRASQNWYFVFNTLTVRQGEMENVFSPTSNAFKKYIQRISYDVQKAHELAGGNAGDDTHTYFAVTEYGSQSGRLHIHCLHAMRALPLGARDPNLGRANPTQRQIERFRQYWRHGFSVPIAVRYNTRDAFGVDNWRWPMDAKTGLGLKAKSPLAIAGYMSKYVLKAYNDRKDYKWRCKKNHQYGTQIINELVSQLTIKTMTTMLMEDRITATLNNGLVPKTLLRTTVLRRLQNIHGTLKQFEDLKGTRTQAALLTRLRDLTQELPTSSQSSPILSIAPGISVEDLSDAQTELSAVAAELDQKYFHKTTWEPKANATRSH